MIAFSKGRRSRSAFLFLWLATPVWAASDPLADVQKAATDWVRIRAETARLESQWDSEKLLLGSLVEGLEERAAAFEEKRDQVKAKTAQDRDEIAAMRAKNDVAAGDLRLVEARAQEFTATLVALRPMLPPRLATALELPYRTLAGSGLSVGERMQVLTSVLNRCVQFNRTITCGEEILAMPGESVPRTFVVIYWGLGQGYALDRRAGQAWRGAPGTQGQGWTWAPITAAAGSVEQLIAIYQDRADPAFVTVPAQLAHPAPAQSQP